MRFLKFGAWSLVFVCSLVLGALHNTPIVSAHEVYVLSPSEVATAVSTASPNPFSAISGNEQLFLLWGSLIAIGFILAVSITASRHVSKWLAPIFLKLKRFAPLAGRLTLGFSMIACGYYGDFFGPELDIIHSLPTAVADLVSWGMIAIGILIVLGFLTRFMSALALCLFVYAITVYHWYMLSYVNYLGEMILCLILGSGAWSIDNLVPLLRKFEKHFEALEKAFERYSYLILRVLFGTALIYASAYAKFLHSNLALDTVHDFQLTNYFHFTPLFLVLGAFIIEFMIGVLFATGFEIRFTAIILLSFLTASLLFFGETVWPHLILFGVNATLFLRGYDEFTLGHWLLARNGRKVV